MSDPVGYHAFLRRLGHDSGDGVTIFHCCFCGSGQVISRSDGTTECEHCGQCFTVTVQPMFPAYPQTIDGQPVQVPGMPARTPQMPPGAPGAPGEDPADDGNPFAGGDDQEAPEEGGDVSDDDGDDDDGNPFAKSSMMVFRNIG